MNKKILVMGLPRSRWSSRLHAVIEARKLRTAKLPTWIRRSFRLVFGYRQRAYDECRAQLTLVRDERDRILRSLEKARAGKAPLPPGLDGRQLCFLHIGKTAGTSVQHALFEVMQDTAIFHESLPNFDRVSAAELAINDLVIGHFMHQHVAKLRPDRFMTTFLRDPVERVISSYHFLRSKSPVEGYSKTAIEAAKAMTLGEFLRSEDPGVRMITENFQAKALAYDIRPEHQGAISDLQGEAERNLSRFDFVGIVEYFDQSIAALSDATGADLSVKKLNINEARSSEPAASSAEIALIRQLNAVDILLYTKAKEKFERTILPALRTDAAATYRLRDVQAIGAYPRRTERRPVQGQDQKERATEPESQRRRPAQQTRTNS
jgi:Galactose-3-O-sulfotransferase